MTAARALAPFVALAWVVAAIVSAAADEYDEAPAWLLLLNQLVLVPVLIGAAWWLGRTVAGRVGAAVAPLAVVLVPVLGAPYATASFRDTYVDRVLTEAVGVADGWRFAAGALLLLAVALVVQRRRPSTLAGVGLAAGVLAVAALHHGVGLDVSKDAFDANMAGLREYTWSNRILQWLPLAGAIGLARCSPLAALLLAAWFGAFALAYGASPNVGVGDGSLFAALVPAFPAFALLVVSVPLLVPTLPARLDASTGRLTDVQQLRILDLFLSEPPCDLAGGAGRPSARRRGGRRGLAASGRHRANA